MTCSDRSSSQSVSPPLRPTVCLLYICSFAALWSCMGSAVNMAMRTSHETSQWKFFTSSGVTASRVSETFCFPPLYVHTCLIHSIWHGSDQLKDWHAEGRLFIKSTDVCFSSKKSSMPPSWLSDNRTHACWSGTDGERHEIHLTFISHVALISLSLCSSEVCLSVWKHRIMFVHVFWAQMIFCGCSAVWWLAHWCLNLAFLCVCLCRDWECAFDQHLFALTFVTFSSSPNTRLQQLSGFQAGLHRVTVPSSLSHNCAAAASCWGSEDLAWQEFWSSEASQFAVLHFASPFALNQVVQRTYVKIKQIPTGF